MNNRYLPNLTSPSRSCGEDTVLEQRARFFTNADPDDTGYAIENDDYLQLQLSRYF